MVREQVDPKRRMAAVKYSPNTKFDSFNVDKPWVEKYRPVSLKDCIGSVTGYLKAFVKLGSFSLCMIFHGEYGDGKSTCASLLERYPNTRTIYTTNYLNDIRDRIVSRAAGGVFEFKKPKAKEIARYLTKILEAEKTRLPQKKILEIAETAPSVRDAVGVLQRECILKKAMKN